MLVEDIEVVFEHRASEKGISFFVETEKTLPSPILLDETRMRQVIVNLLDNAVKFTDHGQVILVVDRVLKSHNKMDLVLTVEDTGIGIPKDQFEMIFDAFHQLNGQNEKKHSGTGLGLTITRRLVEMMGGTINIDSTPGKGSIFKVYIPDILVLTDLSTRNEEEDDYDIRTIRFKKSAILVVDDNLENRKLLVDILEPSPVEVIEARNGKEAVELATRLQTRPDPYGPAHAGDERLRCNIHDQKPGVNKRHTGDRPFRLTADHFQPKPVYRHL